MLGFKLDCSIGGLSDNFKSMTDSWFSPGIPELNEFSLNDS